MKGYEMSKKSAVAKMASLNITGNVISLSWFHHIKLESGKPDTIAIMLLGDIVYWYRPIEVRNEETGQFICNRKKFAADKLQRSYDSFANQYGYTKNQVTSALKRLEDLEVIDLDFRHPTINGVKMGNVLYIGLNVDRLAEITAPLSDLNGRGSANEILDPLDFKSDTNTENTTENTTETTQLRVGLSEKEIQQANAKVDAMISNSRKVKYQNREKIPETYWRYSDLYNELTGQEPTKRSLHEWLQAFEGWKQEGLQDEHIRAAWEYANRPDGGFPVGRPSSLTNTAVAMKSKALVKQSKVDVEFDPYASLAAMLERQE